MKITHTDAIQELTWDSTDNVYRLDRKIKSTDDYYMLPAGMDFYTKKELKEILRGRKWELV